MNGVYLCKDIPTVAKFLDYNERVYPAFFSHDISSCLFLGIWCTYYNFSYYIMECPYYDFYQECTSGGRVDFKQEIECMGNILDRSFQMSVMESVKRVDGEGYRWV